ncbi:MAG: hypothetical protein FD180_4806 [Planctomycetota bacterium]|nr:MAG: hypothetical protein FD180_4806 [Planctomycetota bacterium]
MLRFAVFFAGMVLVAGCASGEKEPAAGNGGSSSNSAKASDRDVAFTIGSKGFHLLVVASGSATLRIVNTGDEALSVCNDEQCFPLGAGEDMEMPVSGRSNIEIHSVGVGRGRAEAHLLGGGEGSSLTERH